MQSERREEQMLTRVVTWLGHGMLRRGRHTWAQAVVRRQQRQEQLPRRVVIQMQLGEVLAVAVLVVAAGSFVVHGAGLVLGAAGGARGLLVLLCRVRWCVFVFGGGGQEWGRGGRALNPREDRFL